MKCYSSFPARGGCLTAALHVAVVMLAPAAPAVGQFGVPISPPAALNSNAGSDSGEDFSVQIATDGKGNWVAVWSSRENIDVNEQPAGFDHDVFVARSTNNGVTWTAPIALNTNAGTDSGFDQFPSIATDGKGNWVVVWEAGENLALPGGGQAGTDADILMARSTDNGATWTPPITVNTNAGTDSGADGDPRVATDGQGNWIVVWHSNEDLAIRGGQTAGTDNDILVARSTDNGATWSAPLELNNNAGSDNGDDRRAQISTDAQGNWVVVWQSTENLDLGGGAAAGTDRDIFVARSTNNGANWTGPAALNTNAGSDSGNDSVPHLTNDKQGHWIAVWESREDLDLGGGVTAGTDTDILVARSTDNGATWTSPAALNVNAGSNTAGDLDPLVATDGRGNWVVVWDSGEDVSLGGGTTAGTDDDIFAARSTDNGATWTAPEAFNANAGSDGANSGDSFPFPATDGAGHWVVAWLSFEDLDLGGGNRAGTDADLFVARFVLPDCNTNGVGDGQDIADGVSADCNTNGVPDECEIDSDGDGVIDECDGCPSDPVKTAPGQCGCGNADTDGDGDGVADCVDSCPTVANAGQEDADGDGFGDACDGCPDDAGKTSPGACGCGVGEADSDGDGVADCVDNCPTVANAGQEDGDGDGVGDVCDVATPPPCGVCGGGVGLMLPLTLLGWIGMRRAARRRGW